MKHYQLLLFSLFCFFTGHAQTANYVPKFTGSGTTVTDGTMYDDDGLVGIGETAPEAQLHIKHLTGASEPDFFKITETSVIGDPGPPLTFTSTTRTHLVVAGTGNVGIGTAEPETMLHLASNKPWAAYNGDVYEQRKIVATNADGEAVFFVSDVSHERVEGHAPAGFLGLATVPGAFALGAFNVLDQKFALGVFGEGLIMVNVPSDESPIGQVDIRPITGAGTVLNIGNLGSALLKLSEAGNLGIGMEPVSSSVLSLKGAASTILDLHTNTTTTDAWINQIRFYNGTTLRHVIADNPASSVDALIIHPGYTGSVHKVLVQGELETTGNITVNGTVTIKSSSGKEFKVYNDGKVRAREIQVDLATIPDYVFDKSYLLKPIEELADYVKDNKHLPNIPGECEYETNGGINLGELNLKLLEKVEELSLYIIQLNERIKKLEK